MVADGESLLVVVLGPTGCGKTPLAIWLARQLNGEIVSCDSVASYREFMLGTAKPTMAERAGVPHHLVDFVDPTSYITAGEYARRAREVLREIQERGHLPIVVGGTGLYLRALLEGLFPGPERREQLRQRLRDRGRQRSSAYLKKLLTRMDPAAAKKIHAHDAPKLIRALEVCLASRQKMTDMWKRGRQPLTGFHILRLGLNPPRPDLYERINRRARGMFESGLIAEAAELLAKYGERAKPLSCLGYKQAIEHLQGKLNREQAIVSAQQAHRNYAKRQMTWFRREPGVKWLVGFGDDPEIQRQAMSEIKLHAAGQGSADGRR